MATANTISRSNKPTKNLTKQQRRKLLHEVPGQFFIEN
jgi:hypothetical protein